MSHSLHGLSWATLIQINPTKFPPSAAAARRPARIAGALAAHCLWSLIRHSDQKQPACRCRICRSRCQICAGKSPSLPEVRPHPRVVVRALASSLLHGCPLRALALARQTAYMYGCVYPRSPSAPGSRGIGRECCLALARQGCSVAIVAKTVVEVNPNLPGTIHTVAKEVEELGQAALPVQCDMRNEEAVEECVEQVVATFGTVHILINNASALWWQDITATPMSKYDLITSINVRGTFAMTQACLPYMEENSFGRIINMSPPIKLDPGAYAGMTAYNISKYGMTSESLTGAVGSAAAACLAVLPSFALWH